MANFPTSVPAFTDKSAGQTIASAHMDAVQDEIVAIGAGYLQGSARLNSSHSTLAALSVSGGSTLAGTLSVAGGSTFAVRPVAPPPDLAKVFATSSHAFASSQFSTITWAAQDILTNSSLHSTGTNPERLIPQSTGIYLVAAQLFVPSPSSGVKGCGILDSSGAAIAYQRIAVSSNVVLNVSGLKRFDALGGYVVCRFEGDGASTNSLSTGVASSWFALTKL